MALGQGDMTLSHGSVTELCAARDRLARLFVAEICRGAFSRLRPFRRGWQGMGMFICMYVTRCLYMSMCMHTCVMSVTYLKYVSVMQCSAVCGSVLCFLM